MKYAEMHEPQQGPQVSCVASMPCNKNHGKDRAHIYEKASNGMLARAVCVEEKAARRLGGMESGGQSG